MLSRNLATKIINLLNQFPAVVILGARQVGKTTLAKQITPNWQYFDLEKPEDYDLISRDTSFFLSNLAVKSS